MYMAEKDSDLRAFKFDTRIGNYKWSIFIIKTDS